MKGVVVREAGLARQDDRVVGAAVAEPADADEVHAAERRGRGTRPDATRACANRCKTARTTASRIENSNVAAVPFTFLPTS